MSRNNVIELAGRDAIIDPLTELLRTGAQRLMHQAVEVELQEFLAAHSQRQTEDGKAGVVRNGYLPARELQTSLGPVTVKILRVRAKTGEPVRSVQHGCHRMCSREITGSSAALTLSEGRLQRRNG